MPAKNIIKPYVEGGFYHILNRGVDKRKIFLDERDYKVFLRFLKRYLSKKPEKVQSLKGLGLHKEISLLAFCLMPNHFHLLIKQITSRGIIKFMRALTTSFVMFFNQRHNRSGALFQGNYKAVLIENEPHLLHLTRYIHLNPLEIVPPGSNRKVWLRNYPYSSYQDYLGKRKTSWVDPREILAYFKTAQRISLRDVLSYQSFVEDYAEASGRLLDNLTLE